MNCDCVTKIDERLKGMGLRLALEHFTLVMPELEKRMVVKTEPILKVKKKMPTPAMILSHCPFCGKKQNKTRSDEP